ncbi:ATP-binding cassette domain-containing protein, partial [bacterium]|nr:ATP-binding cassette domain-containing protein [bacterium]
MSLIHLESVSKIYRVGDQEIRALDQINLRIEEGEFVAIIGPSGSGKSTLMHLLGCLDTPSSGRMVICGNELTRATQDQLAHVRNQEIGFVFQAFNLLAKLDVISNIELPLIYGGVPSAQRRERARKVAF